jgi:uncharacterized protein
MAQEEILSPEVALEQQRFMVKVYAWMMLALSVTAIIAWTTYTVPGISSFLFQQRWLFYVLIISEFLLVAWLSVLVTKMTALLATIVFLAYAALNGLTFGIIFMAFTKESIASTFLITAGTFGVMSLYGWATKSDLSRMGSFLFMALMGLIIATVVNIFYQNSTLYWITTYAGIFIFIGLTAYDTQKIKKMNSIGNEGTDEDRKEAIMGALVLYLDFINLFLLILRARRR